MRQPRSKPDAQIWPAAKTRMVATGSLKAYGRNPRTHSDAQVKQIVASIEQFGFTNPILVDENMQVIAGHGRLAAAVMMKLPQVPIVQARGWTEEQRRAYVIADNQLALNAGWDESLLRLEVGDDRLGLEFAEHLVERKEQSVAVHDGVGDAVGVRHGLR